MKKQIVMASVTGFRPNLDDHGKGFGFARTSDGLEFYFQMRFCRKIIAGPEAPDFSMEPCGHWPERGDRIVIEPDERGPRPGQLPRAYIWGYRTFWDKMVAEIAKRPFYQVRGENRFKGQKMSAPRREEIVVECATAEELQFRFPRDSHNDPLGIDRPYRSGPCQRINRWYKWENADWKLCADPRPMPEKSVDEPSSPAEVRWSHELEELAVNAAGRNRGARHTRHQQGVAT